MQLLNTYTDSHTLLVTEYFETFIYTYNVCMHSQEHSQAQLQKKKKTRAFSYIFSPTLVH